MSPEPVEPSQRVRAAVAVVRPIPPRWFSVYRERHSMRQKTLLLHRPAVPACCRAQRAERVLFGADERDPFSWRCWREPTPGDHSRPGGQDRDRTHERSGCLPHFRWYRSFQQESRLRHVFALLSGRSVSLDAPLSDRRFTLPSRGFVRLCFFAVYGGSRFLRHGPKQ